MRDIKFRGQRKDNKEWAYGNLLHHKDSLGELYLIEEYKADYAYFKHEVYADSVGQDTGIVDSSGIHIFEKDIIKFEWSDAFREYELIGVVEWDDDGYWFVDVTKEGFGTGLSNAQISDILIQGDEINNPELLK